MTSVCVWGGGGMVLVKESAISKIKCLISFVEQLTSPYLGLALWVWFLIERLHIMCCFHLSTDMCTHLVNINNPSQQ